MSWLGKLYETYEKAKKMDLDVSDKLLPIWHTSQNSHIHIIIDGDGNFKKAESSKEKIILPCTESSEGRTSGPEPHPFADKLEFVAKDFIEYSSEKNSHFEKYKHQLEGWSKSNYSHPKINAVYKYICKGTCTKDLLDAGILYSKDGQKLYSPSSEDLRRYFSDEQKPKIFNVIQRSKDKYEQGKALIRWSVEIKGDNLPKTWEDADLQNSWMQYASEFNFEEGLCFVEGVSSSLALNHPKKIRHPGDGAKLISTNDLDGFTFRGRFTDTKKSVEKNGFQGIGIGSVVSQKAHSALRWLISRQGARNDTQVIVAWAVSGKAIPQPMQDSWSLFKDAESLLNLDGIPEDDENAIQINQVKDLGESFALRLKKCLVGYSANLDNYEDIIVMALDSATTGRMGITYYREKCAKDFIEKVKSWHLDFSWPLKKEDNQKVKIRTGFLYEDRVSSPAIYAVAEAAYGSSLTNSLKKNTYERLLPCIIDGRPFPIDLLKSCINRASNPNCGERWEWERNLGIACGLYRGYYRRHPNFNKRREYSMSLDPNNQSRDYLYGRLLAIAENIESFALHKADEKRPTAAERLMQRFADRPYSTWRTIELSLQPYIQRLRGNSEAFIIDRKRQLDAVLGMFDKNDFLSEKKLTGEFLLGFHCQRLSLMPSKEGKEPEVINE